MKKKNRPTALVAGSCPIPPDAPFTILIDTREPFGNAWSFAPDVPTERIMLTEGDYTAKGFEGICAIERKTLDDFTTSIMEDRFWAEIKRTAEKNYKSFVVVVEASLTDILAKRYTSEIKPASVVGAINALAARYRVPTILADDRAKAAHYAHTYLKFCWERRYKGVFWPLDVTPTTQP